LPPLAPCPFEGEAVEVAIIDVVAAALGVNAPYSEGQNRLYYYSSTAVEEVEERACDELYS
jgi:hypothetical protein